MYDTRDINIQWRNYNLLKDDYIINNFRDKFRENVIFDNPTPRVGIIIRCPISSAFNLKVIDKSEYLNDSKYIYLTVYQSASGLWGFPKGRWKNYKETYFQGALRELKEETGIELNYVFNQRIDKLIIKRGKHHHYYFIIDLPYPPYVNIDNNEIIDYRWATLNWISKKNVSYFTENVLDNLKIKEENKFI